MHSWLNTHLQAIKLVLFRMRSKALSSLLICMVIGVAISLPSLFYLAVDHAAKFSSTIQDENEISVFVKLGSNENAIEEIKTILASHTYIKQQRFVSKTEAWQQLKEKNARLYDDGKLSNENQRNPTDLIEENPLPDAFYLQANTTDPEQLDKLNTDLQQIPNVDHVLFNADWSKRLATLLNITKQVIFFIAVLLAIALIVVIGNTIRMQILTQQDEIEVSYLIGATNSFIRTPFLYAGMMHGLFGGMIGIGIILFSVNRFNHYVSALAQVYGSDFTVNAINSDLILVMIATAAIVGWLGAYIAVNRAIADIIAQQKNHQ